MQARWRLGEGGVLEWRCCGRGTLQELEQCTRRKWLCGRVGEGVFAWLLEVPETSGAGWDSALLSVYLRGMLTAKTLPGAVLVRPQDVLWARALAAAIARDQGGVMGVFLDAGEARAWAGQQALVFIGDSPLRVRELASRLRMPLF